MIQIGKDILQDFQSGSAREWLETNGIGGFASSTVSGLNTRRYHGLLTAALHPPAGRLLLLSKLEESLTIDGRSYDLATNQYTGAIHPHGYSWLTDFRIDPFPVSTFHIADVELQKSVFMVHGHNTTVIRYSIEGPAGRVVQLDIRPLIAFRDYHSLTHENDGLDRAVKLHDDGLFSVVPYNGLPTLYVAHDAANIALDGYWYRNFEYLIERERGLDCQEDLFNPCTLRFDSSLPRTINIIVSAEPVDINVAETLRQNEIDRRAAIVAGIADENEFTRTLTAAADQYIVARGSEKTIIAGYPWFTDWGRDTMIALPGLTLATGRQDIARSILSQFARHVHQGMLPNRFPDAGEVPEYNTIDATLWYFEAVRSLLQYTGDYDFVQAKLYPVLNDIIDWHIRGTRYGIKMDVDGLIGSEDPTVQLTWMDAKIGDWVVTPRHGKAVEIQALWYNALRTMEDIANKTGLPNQAAKFAEMADRTMRSFNEVFWNAESECLFDSVIVGERDATVRPNQILAVSLKHSMLDMERARRVVAVVERELFTPYGLRSLSPSDSRYRGRYEGDSVARDSSYHQGPVWAWLLGAFFDAYIRVNGATRQTNEQLSRWIETLSGHVAEAGLGHISEIFDGDAPHRPRGCFAQAWSVAEILRVVVEHWLGADRARGMGA